MYKKLLDTQKTVEGTDIGSEVEIQDSLDENNTSFLSLKVKGITEIINNMLFWEMEDKADEEYLFYSFKDRAGCYVFYDYDGKVLYVGETEDLYIRFAQHLTGNSQNTKRVNIEICEPLYDSKKREVIKDEKGRIINQSYEYELFKYFYKYDVYILSPETTFEERKLFEQALFVALSPYHNSYSNKRNTNRCSEAINYKNRLDSTKKRSSWLPQEGIDMNKVFYTLSRSIKDHADDLRF